MGDNDFNDYWGWYLTDRKIREDASRSEDNLRTPNALNKESEESRENFKKEMEALKAKNDADLDRFIKRTREFIDGSGKKE